MGIETEAIGEVVAVGRMVRKGAAGEIETLLVELTGQQPPRPKDCSEN
jgi:hypothetical protein